MSNYYGRKDADRLERRLVLENIRRVLFASLACVVVVPILILLNKAFAPAEVADLLKGALWCFEIFNVCSVGISYYLFVTRDITYSRFAYRTYWVIFEVVSFLEVYANVLGGSRATFYAVMLAALMLGPLMSFGEQVYYLLVQGVYAIFMLVKFGSDLNDIINIAILNVLFMALSRAIYKSFVDHLSLKEKAKKQEEASMLDSLTGLLDRTGFEASVEQIVPECCKAHRRVSVLVIDIDDLGKYNETYSVEKGNDCIRYVAEIIQRTVQKSTQVICRQRGGYFAVFLEGGNDIEPVRLAEKVRQNIEDRRRPGSRNLDNMFVSVSIGVASCVPRNMGEFRAIYDEAEDAMVEAKERGKNLVVYDEQIYGRTGSMY